LARFSGISRLESLLLQGAVEEESAVTMDTLFDKVVAAKQEKFGEGEELPDDLKSKDLFRLSIKRLLRVEVNDDTAYLKPRRPRREGNAEGGRGKRNNRRGKARSPTDDSAKADGEDGEQPRRRRPMGTPQEPKEVTLPQAANDSTVIANLVYKCVSPLQGSLRGLMSISCILNHFHCETIA
jgi:hypothetical protein